MPQSLAPPPLVFCLVALNNLYLAKLGHQWCAFSTVATDEGQTGQHILNTTECIYCPHLKVFPRQLLS